MRARCVAAAILAAALAALTSFVLVPVDAAADGSPLGDSAAPWPSSFSSYRYTDGTLVQDPLGDMNPTTADLAAGACGGTSCTGTGSTPLFAADGTNVFFRMRLGDDVYSDKFGGLVGNFFVVDIAINGTVVAAAGVNGKSSSTDYVYVTDANNTPATTYEVYDYPFDTQGANSAAMRVVSDGNGQFFLDWQVPLSYITQASGGLVTATTPVQLYYGSSAANNLAVINKDFMTGPVNAIDFTGLSTVVLGAPSVSLGSGPATFAAGVNPPRNGSTSDYDITLTAKDPSGVDIDNGVVSAPLPANVSVVSAGTASGTISSTSSAITWNVGTMLADTTKTATVRVRIDPSPGQVNTTATLLNAQSFAGTAGNNGTTVTASAAAVATPVQIAQANRAPVAGDDALDTFEDTPAFVNVLGNDTDADLDTLIASVAQQPAHGTATVAAGGITYTPNPDYFGPDSFTYTACDSSGACDEATVTVAVAAVDDVPTTTPQTNNTDTNTAVGGLLTAADVDDDALTYSLVSAGTNGATVVVNSDGSYTYTPSGSFVGDDTFTFQVCDPSLKCVTGSVLVSIAQANRTPVADDFSVSTGEGVAVTADPLAHATDADGDELVVSVTAQPTSGTAVVQPDGTILYTPGDTYAATDAFTYQACDPADQCDGGVVTVNVTRANQGPGAAANPTDAMEQGEVLIDAVSATDPDGDSLTFAAGTAPGHGTVVVEADGTFTYTPDPAFSGPDSFTYTACDPHDACVTGTVTITVAPAVVVPPLPNHPPTASAGPDATVASESANILAGMAADEDGDQLTYLWTQTGGPPVSLIGADTLAPTFVAPTGPATLTFLLTVSDGTEPATDTVEYTVTGPRIDPTPTPTPTPTGNPVHPPTATPTPTPTPAHAPAGRNDAPLAATGTDLGLVVGVSAILMAAGIIFMGFGRRRRATR
jgi:hypothetical protein